MMKTIRIAMLLLGLLAAPAWAGQDARVYELGIDGLGCPFCAYGVEKELTGISGVESLDIDLKDGVIIVRMTGGVALDQAAANEAVEDAGFTLRSFDEVAEE